MISVYFSVSVLLFVLAPVSYLMLRSVAHVAPLTCDGHLARMFMVSDTFQEIIPTTNWMFPAVTPASGLPDGFPNALSEEKSLIFSPVEAARLREGALLEWQAGLSQ